jgi:hypothetical protein
VLLRVWVTPSKQCALDHFGAIYGNVVIHRIKALRQNFEPTASEISVVSMVLFVWNYEAL